MNVRLGEHTLLLTSVVHNDFQIVQNSVQNVVICED